MKTLATTTIGQDEIRLTQKPNGSYLVLNGFEVVNLYHNAADAWKLYRDEIHRYGELAGLHDGSHS